MVSLERGEAFLEGEGSLPLEVMEGAIRGQVILARARWLFARLPFLGRR